MEHLCSQAGEERNQFHREPGKPVVAQEVGKVKTDDGEGSIHHDVPHHRTDVQILEETTNKNPFLLLKSCQNYGLNGISSSASPEHLPS